MKMSKTVSAIALASALTIGVSACAGSTDAPEPEETATESTQTATPSASQDPSVEADPGVSGVINTVENLYAYMTIDENLAEFSEVEEKIDPETTNEEAMEKFTTEIPDAFAFYDTSTYDKTISAYRDLTITGTINDLGEEVVVDVPKDAVTIEGDKATVDNAKVDVIVDGETIENMADNDGTNLIHLRLVNDVWLIDASHS